MNSEFNCAFEDAELNHLRDGLAASTVQRWHWLRDAMDFGFQLARQRARQGLVTFDPHGEVLWSPEQERAWHQA